MVLINKNRNKVIPVVLYSAGCITMVFSLGFLTGLNTQIQSLSNKKRRVVVILFLLLSAFTLFALVYLRDEERIPLFIACIALQYVCYYWYSMTYLPISRRRTSRIMDSLLPI